MPVLPARKSYGISFLSKWGLPGSNFIFLSTSLSFWKGYQYDAGIDFLKSKRSEDPEAIAPRGAGGV